MAQFIKESRLHRGFRHFFYTLRPEIDKLGCDLTVHPFGTIKARMDATHLLMKTLPRPQATARMFGAYA
jgi:hypothetical protein